MPQTRKNARLPAKMADFYASLDARISQAFDQRTLCRQCGKCCNFKSFGHRLFITTAELLYLQVQLAPAGLKSMSDGICPYREKGKCTIHENRFAACRIFFCQSDEDIQSELTEQALKELKQIHADYGIPYRYMDLATALNDPKKNLKLRTV